MKLFSTASRMKPALSSFRRLLNRGGDGRGAQYPEASVDLPLLFATIAIVLAGLVLLTAKTGIGVYALDDAYIIDHSVKGILAGHESRFINSTPWEGVTSPAYVASVAILSLIAPIQHAHWLVSTLSTLFLTSGWYLLCRRHALNAAMTMGVVFVSLTVGGVYYQLTNGLETGMAMAAFTWMLVALEEERPADWAYALGGIQCFIRPELAALSMIFAVCIIGRRPAGWRRGALIALGVFATATLLLFLASGSVVPNTLSAKVYFFSEACQPSQWRSSFVQLALRSFAASLGLFSVGFAMALASRQRLILLSFFALFLAAYFLRFPGALFHNYHRYQYLLFPIAVLGWATCLGHGNRIVRIGSVVLGSVVAGTLLLSAGITFRTHVDDVNAVAKDNLQMAHWVARNVPPEAVVMVHDAGRISTVGEHPLVDLVGLKSPFSVAVHRNTTFKACTRVSTAITEIASKSKASYMVVTADWDRLFLLTESFRVEGWTVERADVERGESNYRVYRISGNPKDSG